LPNWRRALGQAGMLMAGGLLLLVAAMLAAAAAWLALADRLGPVWASLAVAGGCLVAGLILLALAWRRPARRAAARPAATDEAALRALFAELGLQMPEKGERPPLLQAFLFGLATARRLDRSDRR
jgi:hypothetical protein